MKVVAVNSEAGGWDSFVESAQDATPYHQLRWRDVITKSFGHPCHYPAAIDDKGEWQGVLPLVHMRSRFFGNFLVSVETRNSALLRGNGPAQGRVEGPVPLVCAKTFSAIVHPTAAHS